MRTLSARKKAETINRDLRDLMAAARASSDPAEALLNGLANRSGWSRRGTRELVHRFGQRQAVITIPREIDLPRFIALVTRAEVSVLLGDCDWDILKDLQALASRELEQIWQRGASEQGLRRSL
jgi:hypothetical protein